MAKILLISTDSMMIGYLIPILELADQKVTHIESVDMSLQLILGYVQGEKESLPELIFIDQSALSSTSPLEVQKKLNSLVNSAQLEIPILFILEENSLKPDSVGQIDYLLKPANILAFPDFLHKLRISLDKISRIAKGNLSKDTTLVANLAEEHLPSLLQMLSLVRASGYAALNNPRTKQTGTIHIRYGDITKIVLVDTSSSPKRRLEGTEALQALVDWKDGVFSFGRANPEKMPPGDLTRWVVLKCGAI